MEAPEFADFPERTCTFLLAGELTGDFEMPREIGEREDTSGFQGTLEAFTLQAEPELVGAGIAFSFFCHQLGRRNVAFLRVGRAQL